MSACRDGKPFADLRRDAIGLMNIRRGVLIIVLAGIGGAFLFGRGLWNIGMPEGLIQTNGRIEGDHLTVASKFPGRVQELLVREGQMVTAGQVMVRLDDTQTRARVDQVRHAWEAIEAQVQAAHTTLAVLNLDVPLASEAAGLGLLTYRLFTKRPKA